MRKETKSKIYKATVRPIKTYALEEVQKNQNSDICWKQMR